MMFFVGSMIAVIAFASVVLYLVLARDEDVGLGCESGRPRSSRKRSGKSL